MLKLIRNQGGMMSWFNYIGLIIIILLLVPNIIYAIKIKEELKYQNKVLDILENIGRYGSMFFMVLTFPILGCSFILIMLNMFILGLMLFSYCVIYLSILLCEKA